MPITRRELIRRFRKLGFRGPYSGGKHQFMAKGSLKVRVPNPHRERDITDALLNEVLRQADISKAEWEE